MMPLAVRLVLLFGVGACLGSVVNWAVYTLAWHARPVSPWSPAPPGVSSRTWVDRLPIVGWFCLKREAGLFGRGFWLRPMLLEVGTGVVFAALYWWEIWRWGLGHGQWPASILPTLVPYHVQYVSHLLLFCLMLAASFIDIDEKTIPDEITLPGTLLGLMLATLAPFSLLTDVTERTRPPVVGQAVVTSAGEAAMGPNNGAIWLVPVTVVSPNPWPPAWAAPSCWTGLGVGLGCYWLWCFALAPRIWRGRRGVKVALRLILARLNRELTRPPLRWLLMFGTFVISLVFALDAQGWRSAHSAWLGLLTALVGLAASGGLVWAVRLIGTAALQREAMGFGDVTLMMMIGTFLGWQAGLITFFLAPFAGLLIGLAQLIFRRDDVIPYGPFLCLGAATVVVAWEPIWNWARPIFQTGPLVPLALLVCLALLGIMLFCWRLVKTALFGRQA